MTRPLISIVTPVLNRVSLIGAALDSVCRAGRVPREHLVVDGGSTDGTLSLLRSRPGIRLVEARARTLTAEFPVALRPADVALGAPAINALFIYRRLYDRIGYFDPRFRLAAGRELAVRG